ncbi:DNA polymerase [Ralstonia phage RsoP1IDN]|uniref:DNA polymerase n=1 Tax=Ralstonia phage RsoP1IDN TaxID=2060091 RepID=A0A2P0VPE7_9CAUD|nr:DNA polymerase [Ralstonia phage RsoP1IDN]AUG85414.1 DNA polymerase [Ralstonia phage RsoP1IDN]
MLYALGNPNSYPEQNLAAWMDWVLAGGLPWDCQIVEYLLRGMEPSSTMLSLDEVAVHYGGTTKIDEVKALWAAGIDTWDIPRELLIDYLVGRTVPSADGDGEEFELGDIGNTELVFRAQLQRAKEQGQLRSIILNMGAYVATIEMERNGMHVNKAKGLKLAEKMAARLIEMSAELAGFIPEDLPFEFNWNSRFHKSALIFGGKIKYEARTPIVDAVTGEQVYAQKDAVHVLLADGTTMDRDEYLAATLANTAPEALRFVGGKNMGELKTKKVKVNDLSRPKSRMEDHYYTFGGFTKPDPSWEGATPGVYSCDSDVMAALSARQDVPFVKVLTGVVALTKDLGTYFITTDEKTGHEKGMLTLVHPNDIVHHTLNMCRTVTARLSSSDPNLQNIPKGQKSEAKTMFESRFGADGKIIQSDFSSLEVYVQAMLTRCKQLIADLAAGIDMHCMRLAAKEKMEYEEVLRLCKKGKVGVDVTEEERAEWDYKRTGAKSFSFQRAYGAGVAAIAAGTGIPLEDVQALADAEDARYPEIVEYFDRKADEIRETRTPTLDIVEHPEIPGLKCQLGRGYSVTPDGKRYSYRESPSPKYMIERGRPRTGFVPTQIKNYEVQGTGGEVMKAAMWLTVRAFYFYRCFNGKALLVNTVHDAQYVDAHKTVAVKAAALLHACMVEASTLVEWWFKWELPIGVPSDTVWGDTMAEEKEIEDERFEVLVAKCRPWLRKKFIGGHEPSWAAA